MGDIGETAKDWGKLQENSSNLWKKCRETCGRLWKIGGNCRKTAKDCGKWGKSQEIVGNCGKLGENCGKCRKWQNLQENEIKSRKLQRKKRLTINFQVQSVCHTRGRLEKRPLEADDRAQSPPHRTTKNAPQESLFLPWGKKAAQTLKTLHVAEKISVYSLGSCP